MSQIIKVYVENSETSGISDYNRVQLIKMPLAAKKLDERLRKFMKLANLMQRLKNNKNKNDIELEIVA